MQPTVSALFLFEIVGVLAAHVFYSPSQFKLFYTNTYYWYLLVIAVCSMVASIPVTELYNPQMASNGWALFQVGLVVLTRYLHTCTSAFTSLDNYWKLTFPCDTFPW